MSTKETFRPRVTIAAEIDVTLTLEEARALNALTVYGTDTFLKFFYEKLGSSYLKPHEAGLKSLFYKASEAVPSIVGKFADANDVFYGKKLAVNPEK